MHSPHIDANGRLADPWAARRLAHELYDEMRGQGFRGNSATKAGLVRGAYRCGIRRETVRGRVWGYLVMCV